MHHSWIFCLHRELQGWNSRCNLGSVDFTCGSSRSNGPVPNYYGGLWQQMRHLPWQLTSPSPVYEPAPCQCPASAERIHLQNSHSLSNSSTLHRTRTISNHGRNARLRKKSTSKLTTLPRRPSSVHMQLVRFLMANFHLKSFRYLQTVSRLQVKSNLLSRHIRAELQPGLS